MKPHTCPECNRGTYLAKDGYPKSTSEPAPRYCPRPTCTWTGTAPAQVNRGD